MNSVAVTMLRVAVLCRSMRSQVLDKAGKLARLVLVSALLPVSPALAGDDLAGEGTVAEWRANLGRSEVATASYAAGVMAMGNVFTECKNRRTVRELHAYLLYRALPMLTMKQAIVNFLIEADCTMMSQDRAMASNFPQWKAKRTDDGEEIAGRRPDSHILSGSESGSWPD